MVFKKSDNFTANRWEKAREYKLLYEKRTGDTSKGLRDFYKNDNPITEQLVKYEVTYEMNYAGDGYEFFIPQESYTVYSWSSLNAKQLEENNKQAIASIFRGKSKDFVYSKTEVKVRGVEQETPLYNEIDLEALKTNNTYASNLPKVEVGKGKTKAKATKNDYKLDIWL